MSNNAESSAEKVAILPQQLLQGIIEKLCETRETMQRFGRLFASPPEVSVNSVLVEMMQQGS